MLAKRLGFANLLHKHVRLRSGPGAANPGAKAMTVIASLLTGGDCIEDVDVLRKGNTEVVLGSQVMAPSTIGTFLRSFSSGHARQLDAVLEDLLQRAWDAGAGPSTESITVDLDSSLLETYGLQKQGAKRFAYTHVRGYHPLFAVLAEQGEVLHCQLREGRANSGRGAGSFARQALARLRRAMRQAPRHLLGTVGATTSLARSLAFALGPAAVTVPWALASYSPAGIRAAAGVTVVVAVLAFAATVGGWAWERRASTRVEAPIEEAA